MSRKGRFGKYGDVKRKSKLRRSRIFGGKGHRYEHALSRGRKRLSKRGGLRSVSSKR